MPKHLIPVMSLIAAVIIMLMLNFTTPTDNGPLGVLVFFLACYVLVLGIALMLVKLFFKLSDKQMNHKGYLYAAIIAFGPIMLLLIRSLGSLSPFTATLVAIVVFLACFLVNKSK